MSILKKKEQSEFIKYESILFLNDSQNSRILNHQTVFSGNVVCLYRLS